MAHFRVFGPLHVEVEGSVLDLGPPKQRAVLVVLLLESGHPVAVRTLIDRVWAGEPPLQPRNALYGHITRIRRMLAQMRQAGCGEESVELVRRPNGYVLHVDPDQVDVHRFGRLIDRAADPSLTDVLRESMLREALDLWRDPPLADLSGPWATGLRQGLVQQRLNAFLSWARTALRVGHPEEVVTRAHRMLAEHPIVEPLAALLIRALYQAGRAAEALDQYEATRRRLADELGTDPSPELRDLHLSILRGVRKAESWTVPDRGTRHGRATEPPDARRPALERHPGGRPHPPSGIGIAGTRPAQLPPELGTPIGRERELRDLLAFAGHVDDARGDDAAARSIDTEGRTSGTGLLIAVDGMAGIGKTTLIVHLAHRLAPGYPDGRLFLDLHGFTRNMPPTSPATALDRLLRSVGVPAEEIPRDLDERAALWRTCTADRRYLILLDNAADEDQVRPLLCASPASLTLITSRRRLSGLDNAHLVSLDVLSEDAAIAMFRSLAGREHGEDANIAEVVRRCGRLPLAVRLLATRLRTRPAWTVGDLVRRLDEPGRRLSELGTGERGVAAAFGLSYEQLDDYQRRIYRLLGLFPGADFDAHAAAALADVGVDKVESALEAMVDAHLLSSRVYGRYHFHDLLRAHACDLAERTDPEGERSAALSRLLDHYLATAAEAVRRYIPGDPLTSTAGSSQGDAALFANRAQAGRWLDAERGNLVAMAAHAAERGKLEPLRALSSCLFRYLSDGAHLNDAVTVHAAFLRVARENGARHDEAKALWRLGETYYRSNRHDLALDHLDRALSLLETWSVDEQERRTDLAYALAARGSVLEDVGRFAEARDCLAKSADLHRRSGDRAGEARLLCAVSELDRIFGRFDLAADKARRALELAAASGDRMAEAAAYRFLGSAYLGLGRYEEAIDHLRHGLLGYREMGSRPRESLVLVAIGHALRGLGQRGEAGEHYRQALTLAQTIGNRNSEFEARHGLGVALLEDGDHDAALEQLHTALALARELGQEHDQARAHWSLAKAYRAKADEAATASIHERAAEAFFAKLGVPPAPE